MTAVCQQIDWVVVSLINKPNLNETQSKCHGSVKGPGYGIPALLKKVKPPAFALSYNDGLQNPPSEICLCCVSWIWSRTGYLFSCLYFQLKPAHCLSSLQQSPCFLWLGLRSLHSYGWNKAMTRVCFHPASWEGLRASRAIKLQHRVAGLPLSARARGPKATVLDVILQTADRQSLA